MFTFAVILPCMWPDNMVKLRLREILAANNLSQAELARQLGVSTVTVNGWVTHRRLPTIETLDRIANLLSIHITQFFPQPPAISSTTPINLVYNYPTK